jgi:ubiquitin-protein ligase
MTILEDDWSPFLSLTSLMESLDKMLEEPDEDYAINTDVLADYRNNR